MQQQAFARGFKPLHLKIFLSNKYAYAQVVRMDGTGAVVAAASNIEKPLRLAATKRGLDKEACKT